MLEQEGPLLRRKKKKKKMNDKKLSIVYTAYLYLRGRGIVDLDDSGIYLNALKDFDILEKEANEDVFGEGIYEVILMKNFYDERHKLIKGECLKKSIVDRGDEL